jgi:hypothetical protein
MVFGAPRKLQAALTILRALSLYSIEDIFPHLRDVPDGPRRNRAVAECHLQLGQFLENATLIELLPIVLQERQTARRLAPELVTRESLEQVAGLRTWFVAHESGSRVAALEEEIRRLEQARHTLAWSFAEHHRTHPIHRMGRWVARLVGRDLTPESKGKCIDPAFERMSPTSEEPQRFGVTPATNS